MSSESPLQVLPRDFYRGRKSAYKVLMLTAILIVGSFSVLTVSGRLDVWAVLGPHVQRSEWAFTMTGARELNGLGLTGNGINVCVVDSGIDALHPDFAHARILAWHDFVSSGPEPYDDSGHGTHMASIIAASGSLRGIAPNAGLIIAKVVRADGTGNSSDVAAGIQFCLDPWGDGRGGADIISLSLGSKAPLFVETKVTNAVSFAVSRGVIVVAAAGNDGILDDGDVELAAAVPLAIAVGAVDADSHRALFSSIGMSANRTDPNLKPEVAAPGVRIITSSPGAHYITVTGTSPATAIVAGILALILEARPTLRPSGTSQNVVLIKEALAQGAKKVPGQFLPHDPWYGYGIIDGPATLAAL